MSEKQFPLDEVTKWIAAMEARGIFNSNTARLRTTAIEQFATILADDEPKTAKYMADNIESIADRWTRKKNANPDTAAAYRARARAALEDFNKFQDNPTGFKPKSKPTNGDGAKKAAEKDTKKSSTKAEPAQLHIPVPPAVGFRAGSCPVSEGEFSYGIPEKGLTVADVQRIALHLLTMTKDFDPVRHTNFFALARTDN